MLVRLFLEYNVKLDFQDNTFSSKEILQSWYLNFSTLPVTLDKNCKHVPRVVCHTLVHSSCLPTASMFQELWHTHSFSLPSSYCKHVPRVVSHTQLFSLPVFLYLLRILKIHDVTIRWACETVCLVLKRSPCTWEVWKLFSSTSLIIFRTQIPD